MTKNYSTTSAVRPKCMLDQHAKNAFVALVAKSITRLIKLENIKYTYTMKTIFPLTLITLVLFGFSTVDRSVEIKVDASRTVGELKPFWASQIIHPTEFLRTEWGRDFAHPDTKDFVKEILWVSARCIQKTDSTNRF